MKHLIIQMIENSTGDYHYPVTLYEAIKDSVGTSLEDILRKKLLEFGLDYDEIVNKKIEDAENYIIGTLEEGDIRELREQIIMINKRLSSKESQISYLASNWVSGILPIELTDIYQGTPRTLYIRSAEEEPVDAVVNDYWMEEEDPTYIRVKISDNEWSQVSENTAIMLYGMTTIYARGRGQYYIESGTDLPVSLGINYDRIGDIYISVQDPITPYVWLGTVWNRLNDHPTIDVGAKSSLDPIIDITCSRKLSLSYSTVETNTDYRYDGVNWYSNYTLDDTLKRFLRSILPEDLSSYTNVIRYIHIGPKKPTSALIGDAWISPRDNRLYINNSTNDIPAWVLQVNDISSATNVKCTNLYYKSERFNAYEDRQLWLDIRTGVYSTLDVVDQVDDFGVQEFYGPNKSIGQKVRIKPNTLYTFSMTMKPKQSGEHPVLQFLADGCEIHSTSIPNNTNMTDDGYVRYWMLFTTGPNIYESTCRIETKTGESVLCYAPCLQEGFNQDWSPSLSDSLSGLDEALQTKISTVILYREYSVLSQDKPVYDGYIWIKDNGSVFQRYERDHWEVLSYSDYEGLSEAVESIYSIYTSEGITKLILSHNSPDNPSVGDYWIWDDYTATRYTGSSWGNITGVLVSETSNISSTLKISNDILVQNLFMESTIDADDLYDIASQLDPTITLYKQGTAPTDPNTGDLWENTLTGIILRYNGTSWVDTGSAQLSNVKQDIDGIETNVSIIYDGGSGRNYIQHSISMAFQTYITALYTDLDPDSHYVLSVQSSNATGISQYTVRLMDELHSVDYDNKVFTIGNTVNIWRFNLDNVPAGVNAHLVVTYASEGSNLILNKVQLEKGYVYTDWKAAIEDTEDSIDVANSNIVAVQTDLVGHTTEIDRISQELVNAIGISNEALARAVTVTQAADSLQVVSSALVSDVSDMQNQLSTYSSVFDFKPEGLQISSLINGIKSDISTYYRSNGMYFWSESAGSDVGYVTADGLNIRNARVQLGGILAMGNFQWKPRSNGSLSLIYLEE